MDTMTPAPVVVGVDGTTAALSAVRYAAFEAERLGAPLHVLHVTPSYPQRLVGRPEVPPDVRQTSLALLRTASDVARATASVDVHARLLAGSPAHVLTLEGREAQLIVLGAPHPSVVDRISTGSIASRVCLHADCRVVVVPPEWAPDEPHGRVVVGFKTSRHGAELLAHAVQVAAARGAELVVVHAWRFPSGYDEVVASPLAADQLRRMSLATIQPWVDAARRARPEVSVRVEVVHDKAAPALIRAARDADLVLLQRSPFAPVRHRLGSCAGSVLREASCPVEVLPAEFGSGAGTDERRPVASVRR
jgi:nucleotide-binding universal stress UspA family protein